MQHDEIRDELVRQLTYTGDIPEYYTVVEKSIQIPMYSNYRIPDVRLLIGPSSFFGIVFEIKTDPSTVEIRRAMGQLSDYRQSGWHPVIVAKEDVFRPRTLGKISYQDMSLAFNASWVKYSEKDSGTFELMHDNMPGKPGLPYPITDVDFKDWIQMLNTQYSLYHTLAGINPWTL